MAAAELLAADWGVASEVFSVTSFSELARDAREVERENRLQPGAIDRVSHVQRLLAGTVPVIAATDYVRAWPQLIAEYVGARFVTLGTDGFGRSDTRSALRRFFEVDRHHVVLAALQALVRDGACERTVLADALRRYGIGAGAAPSWAR
jgi:pyruvate dehydrogenase E1 component